MINLPTDEAAFGVLVEENILFIGSMGVDNLKVFDVVDPRNPLFLSSLTVSGTIYGIVKIQSSLFLSTYEGSLVGVDISDINIIKSGNTLNCQGRGMDLAHHQGYLYFANSFSGLQVIDIGNPESPQILTIPNGSNGAWDIYLDNGFLYLGKHMLGFSVYSIDNPALPSLITERNTGGEVYGIYSSGNYLYTGDLVNGVEVWDIGNKNSPVLLETISEYSPHDIFVDGNYIYLADQDRHFIILEYPLPK